MPRFVLPLVLTLSACMPVTPPDIASRTKIGESTLPPMKVFGGRVQPRRAISNAELAADFLDLSFQLESGRALPVFTRFDGPISVRVTGAAPASLAPDLTRLLARLKSEAGIAIQTTNSAAASITIEAVSRAEIRRALPEAACFVAPNVSSLAEYRKNRRSSRTNWTLLQTRTKLAIFLPNDASPQEVRDCLHEELAQAIGPLNDLYRLPDTVFNDDNVHTVLTGFDMLILRAYYAPELASGMTRNEVAARLPAILSRINPAGRARPTQPPSVTPREWSNAIQTALGHGTKRTARRNAAVTALRIAADRGWQDHRTGFAHYAMGRILQASDPDAAQAHYLAADRYYAGSSLTQLHRAYVATQLAAFAISEGRGRDALRRIEPHIPIVSASENAALLSTLLLLRAEALELENRFAEARSVRLDSLGWARYGFGPDWAVRAKQREVASLNPLNG
ncbi:MAG: DUF2927 domain-containing protein [Sulfitobacter sp.]